MRTIRLAAAGIMMTAIFAVSAMAQTAPTGKIGLVDSVAFLEKTGITKLVAAMTALENEFKPAFTEGQALVTKAQNLETEIKKLQEQINAPAGAVPIDKAKLTDQLNAKADEFQTLDLTIKRKREDLKNKYERRQDVVLAPIQNDIAVALNEFAAKNGYSVILNGNKLQEAQILMGFDPKSDITKDFITFYNARTPSTASATKP